MKKAVYFFCKDLERDPVAFRIFDVSTKFLNLKETDILIDDCKVLYYEDDENNLFYYVRTNEVLSHDYATYLPVLNQHFDDFDFAGLVNWHAGQNAPEGVLSVHTTGDVPSVSFGNADPVCMRNLLLTIESNRKELMLDDFSTVTEATHWSGVPYNGDVKLIPQFRVPLVDIEIGSSMVSWSNGKAAEAIARALPHVFDDRGPAKSILCVGGIHFESSFYNALFIGEIPVSITHVIANQWISCGEYEGEKGVQSLDACVKTIKGGVDAIFFHDNLKGAYKQVCRELAAKLGIPAYKHQILRKLDNSIFTL